MYWCRDCEQPFEEFAHDANGERCCPWCEGYRIQDSAALADLGQD